jgi:hydroxymethylglutaryl-CoA lyase
MIKITEAPRDAMQGIQDFIPTSQKVELINDLLKVGFDIIDFGSFVSPKAIPQLRDTAEVVKKIDLTQTKSRLMAIVGNTKGAQIACGFDEVSLVGFPFSFSETFLKLNINSSVAGALKTVNEIQDICIGKNKKMLVYISMAFGNPYGDPWSIDTVFKWARYFEQMGIEIIALSDITGKANGHMIAEIFGHFSTELTNIEVGLHLHTLEKDWYEKVDAAYKNGCRRFDGVLGGIGGCPMTGYELVGNLNTHHILSYADKNNIKLDIDREAFENAFLTTQRIFPVTKP